MLNRELGIGIVAYSPLGRGFFSVGPKVVESFNEGDYRKVCSILLILHSTMLVFSVSQIILKACKTLKSSNHIMLIHFSTKF